MSEWLMDRFSRYADRPFLAQGDHSYNYSELSGTIQKYYTLFTETGIRGGDIVTLETDYSLAAIAALFALFKLKTIVAPITTSVTAELVLRRAEAKAHWSVQYGSDGVTSKRLNPTHATTAHKIIEPLIKAQRPGLILFSSGSTGVPKAMLHDADSLLNNFSKKGPRRHRILIFLLFDHIGGLNTLFHGLASGALIAVPSSREADAVGESIQRHKVTLLPASPTFLNLLLINNTHTHFDLSSLRLITYGTEPMPESLLHRLKIALPNVAFIQTFGTSETGISQTTSRSSKDTRIKIDDPNTEFKIVDNELWLRSKTQILGYLNHDMSNFTDDGWFKTGDIVEQSEDGFLSIQGREVEMINVGGEKVTPLEIENLLLEIPEVADCLVYGEQNLITGQNVVAEIVPTDADFDTQMLKRTIKHYCRKRLSPYKVPARIRFSSKTNFNNRYKKNRSI